jgi:tetratricopeptide (TPR) repeat protein
MWKLLSMKKNLVAFVSYAHADDAYDKGAITDLARRLEGAIRAFTGQSDLQVFIDRTSIEWGDTWRIRLAEGLADSMILIAIVTPNYLSSHECRNEIEAFLALPEREHWLLPIYYMEVTDFDARDDLVSKAIHRQQYKDWHELRTVGRTSIKLRKAIEELARRIRDLLRTAQLEQQSNLPVVSEDSSREYRAQATGADAKGRDWIDCVLAARAASDNEEYALARALLLEALDQSRNAELLHELAFVDWYDGALDAAVAEFEQALAELPAESDRLTVLSNLGQARVERGDFKRGIDELTTVVEKHPDEVVRAYARSTRALGFGGIGRFQEALEELAAAEQVTPDNAWLHFNRARVLDWQKDPGASACYLRSLVLKSPPLNRPKRQMAQRRLLEMGWRG